MLLKLVFKISYTMQQYKLNNLKREKPDFNFDFESIPKGEFEKIVSKCKSERIKELFFSKSPFTNFMENYTQKVIVPDLNKVAGFNELINKVSFNSDSTTLFVFWNANEVDKIKVDTLKKFWEYIWYDDSDEAVIIFDSNDEKVIMVVENNTAFIHK